MDRYSQIEGARRTTREAGRAKERNKGEDELMKRLEASVATAESDLKRLREILERI